MKFHFEMGAFTDPDLMKELLNNIIYKVNSLGMNE